MTSSVPPWLPSVLPDETWWEAQRAKRARSTSDSLLGFIEETGKRTTPNLEPPTHLLPIVDTFELIAQAGDAVRRAFSVPPRHWKSTTILHGCVWLMQRIPGFRVLYLTYAQDFAERQSRDAQRIVRRAGLELGDRDTQAEWNLANGSVFRAAGLIGGATGEGFHLIVVDDPYRKRQDAESLTIRRRVSESFTADVFTRQGNEPTSFIVVHTRWHVDDLIGEVTQPDYMDGHSFKWTNLPALNDEGEPLLPKYWGLARLKPHMANAYEWASQFMGSPRPRGSEVFGPPSLCTLADLPNAGRVAQGLDFAYTAKTQADFSAFVSLKEWDGRVYVTDVVKRQVQARDFANVIVAKQLPGVVPRWYCAGAEKGVADLLAALGARVDARPATTDKYVRAQPVADAWNEGRIVVPHDAPWAKDFLDEVTRFTGVGDAHDDQVDALAAAYDCLATQGTGTVETWDRGTGRGAVRGFKSSY